MIASAQLEEMYLRPSKWKQCSWHEQGWLDQMLNLVDEHNQLEEHGAALPDIILNFWSHKLSTKMNASFECRSERNR